MTRAEVRAAERRKRAPVITRGPVMVTRQAISIPRKAVTPYDPVAAERRRIRRELLNSPAMRKGVWVYAASVVEAIKKATRGTR